MYKSKKCFIFIITNRANVCENYRHFLISNYYCLAILSRLNGDNLRAQQRKIWLKICVEIDFYNMLIIDKGRITLQ